ncbi:MAG: permease [Alphaproteobacteria bacterium]|jgi:uncharacterized membrane protein YraQ (UPF0718 family)|nr:permease [Alphaproteobacteria bacterium]MCV6598936.1 permease [Alphaproteobacteria bacterium]
MLKIFDILADLVVYNWLGLAVDTRLAESLHFFVLDVTKILCLLALIMFVVSFFRARLNTDKLRTYLESKPKWLAYILAVSLGAITPFCSCSSIPLFIGFLEAGIPFGVVMAFLITSPMINEVAVPILWGEVGTTITLTYIATGMIAGIAGGLFMDKMGFKKYVEDYVWDLKIGKNNLKENKMSIRQNIEYAYNYAKDTIKKLTPYILIGIAIGAFIHGYVPATFFEKYAGEDNWFAVPFAVLFGIPLYTDAVGIIPVAKVLIAKSVPIGTVLAMMMSVVAISLPEMMILRKVMKPKLIIYFALTLFVMFNIVGYFYNLLF